MRARAFFWRVRQNNTMAYLRIILFLISAIGILFGAHWLLYVSILRFFAITNFSHKLILLFVLAFFGISFFTSSFLARFSESLFTRDLYFLSAFWLGLLLNLILATAVMWALVWGAEMVGASLNQTAFASILFMLAFSYSIYGAWNAFTIRVKEVSVHIPNLPDTWKGRKIVQLSDVHLGIVHREAFMRDIVNKTNAVNPEMVVITGDLFDGMDGDLNPLVRPLNDIKAEKGTFFITGNHETYLGVKESLDALTKVNVRILKNEVADVNGLKIIGINYPTLEENENVVSVLDSLKSQYEGKPNVLLYHAPTFIDEIKTRGVNLELCGHTHKGQLFPFGFITSLVYKGYDYGLYTSGNYTLYTTTGAGTWGPPMRTGNHPEIVVITLN